MTDTAPTLSSHIYAPAPGNTSIDTPNRRDDPGYPKLEAMPKAPPPLEDYQMRGFHRQAEKQGLGDRKTLGRYVLVANGISMNSGYSNGWESYNIPINEEALVYVKNIHGIFITPVNVRAGILSINLQQQGILLPPGFNHIFKFRNQVGKWYLSVGSATDAYMLEYEVWTRVKYAD
jgi:hypothetical protein